MNTFEELSISAPVARAIKELGYETPSPIQAQALPLLLGEPTDFIGLAATGTGKTAAFAIPLLEQIDLEDEKMQGLILCPTRELAMQVTGQINLLGKFKDIRAVAIYGGASHVEQVRNMRHARIVVATPGRLIDHLGRGALSLDSIKTVVLDEADEMISMGFKEALEMILQNVPRETSKTWLFSATMSSEVRKVANAYLSEPKQVQVNRTEVLSSTVEQVFYPSRESDKPEILCKLIEVAEDFYGLVFCQTKSLVVDLTHYLTSRGYKVDCLHGDKTQGDRERTMQAFRDKKVRVLVCTDVASRGLDVKDVTHVVNYSIPRELEVYVHRIGRTARSGKAGMAISLVTPSHRGLIPRIEKLTKSSIKEGRIPSRREIGAKKVAKIFEEFQSVSFHDRAMAHLHEDWQAALLAMSKEEIAARFIAMISPESFDDSKEKQKPLQSHVPMDAHGNALPHGGNTHAKPGGYRDRRERDGERRHSRGSYQSRGDHSSRGGHPSRDKYRGDRHESRGPAERGGQAEGGESHKESPAQRKARFKSKPRSNKHW
jgi:ATP-dependent RNA helicase DeaD